MIGYLCMNLFINQKSFSSTHVFSMLYHISCYFFDFIPSHGKQNILFCRISISCYHAIFINPYRYRMSVQHKSFSNFSVFLFQKISHFFRRFSMLILIENPLSAIISSASRKNYVLYLFFIQRKSNRAVLFHTCFRCLDIGYLFCF